MGKIFILLFALATHIFGCVFAYYSWVEHNIICQVISWIIMFFSILGICTDEFYDSFNLKIKSPWFWIFYIPATCVNMWIYFGQGHSGGLYGMTSIVITLAMFAMAFNKETNN